jgi:hypothetical protein
VFIESCYWDGEQQVPPLRFATVGMTVLFGNACVFIESCYRDGEQQAGMTILLLYQR